MTALTLVLLVAAAGFALSQRLRVSVIPLLIVGGFVLGHAGPGLRLEHQDTVLELGLTFLLFTAGIELNPARFSRHRRAVLWVGLVQFAVMGVCGWAVSRLLGFGPVPALYVGCALCTSSTLVVLRLLRQRQQMFEPFGRLVIGVLLLQDLLMMAVIVVVPRLPQGTVAVITGVGRLAGLVGLALVCQRWVFPRLAGRLQLDDELLLVSVLAVLFGFIGLAYNLGLPTLTGAFLAGVAFSAFPINVVVRGQLTSVSDFFVAVFFTSLGVMVTIPSGTGLVQAAVLALTVLLITPPLVTLLAERCGMGSRPAIEAGLLLAQTSEFSLVLGLAGLVGEGLNRDTFSIIALVAVVTMTLTPFLATDTVTRRLIRWHPLRRRLSTESLSQGHVLVLGFGASGMWIIKPLLAEGYSILVVDDDPAVIAQLQRSGIPCLRGDGSDEKVLAKAGARQARLILVGMRRPSEAEKVLHHARGVPVVVRLFEKRDAERIRALGGTPVLNSLAAADTFMDWFGRRQAA